MQGRERNSNDVDEQMVSRAWESMRMMLDQEMPVSPMQKEERGDKRFLLLLLLLMVFGAGASYLHWLKPQPVAESNSTNPVAVQFNPHVDSWSKQEKEPVVPVITQDPPPEIEALATTSPTFTALSDRKETVASKSKFTRVAGTKSNVRQPANRGLENTAPELNHTRSTTISPAIKDPQTDDSKLSTASPQAEPAVNSKELNSSIVPALLEKTQLVLLPVVSRPANPVFDLPKLSKWQWSLDLATLRNQSNQQFNGSFTVGTHLSRKLNPRFAIQTGVEWNHLEKNQNLDIIENKPVENPNFLVNESLFEFGLRSGFLPAQDYLKLPLSLSYKINKSLQLQTGVYAAYLLTPVGNQSRLAQSEPGSEEYWKSIIHGYFNPLDYGFQLAFSYTPVERLALKVNYNAGFGDYTNDDDFGFIEVHSNQYLQLGITYLIKK